MRLRGLPHVALLCLLAVPAPLFAAPKPEKPANEAPGLIVRMRSIDGLLSDFDYLAKLVGKEEEATQARKLLENRIGKDGLAGIDTKRPIGFYGTVGPAVVDSTAVALIPVADEKAVLGLLESLNMKAEKGDDDVYTVQPEGSPVPVFFRFANKYAYVTAQNKGSIDKDKLLDPATIFPKGDTALLSVVGRIDQIPKGLKQAFIASLEEQMAKARDEKLTGDTEAQKKFQKQILEGMEDLVKSLTLEGGAVEFHIDLNRKTEEFVIELSLAGVEDTKLSGSIKRLGEVQSLFGGLPGKDSAMSGLIHFSMPDKIRQAMEPVLDEAVKKELEKETDKTKREEAEKAVAALMPSLKSGELDAVLDIRGPSSDNQYTAIVGVKIKEGDAIEKLARKAIDSLPESEKKKIKLDVAKAGDVAIHQLDISADLDAEAKALFGDKPAYLAVRKDAILLTMGPDALNAMKGAIALKPQKGKAISFEVSLARMAPLMEKETPGATMIAEEAFGKLKDADKIRLTLEGGDSVKLRLSMKTQIIKFGVLMDEAKKK
jgi:hypothetical protein